MTSTANILPSFSTLVSDLDRFHNPKPTSTPCFLPSLSSLNLLPVLVNTTIFQQDTQSHFFSHKRKIEFIDTVSIHSRYSKTSQPLPSQTPAESSTEQVKLPSAWKKSEHKKQKLNSNKPTKLISVGSLHGVLSEVLEQATAGDPEEEEEASKEPVDALGALFVKLRTQVYVQMIEYSETSKRYLGTETSEKRFVCPFSSNCKKTLKGLGNLRRHIEWHLTRLEDDVRYQAKYLSERITTQKACSLVLQELERAKKTEDSPL